MAPSWRPSAGGDPTAAEDLVAAYGDRACRLATRITGNAQDAEEAVQDAFLSVIRRSIRSVETPRSVRGSFGSWPTRAYQRCRRRPRRGADVSLDRLLSGVRCARPPRRAGR